MKWLARHGLVSEEETKIFGLLPAERGTTAQVEAADVKAMTGPLPIDMRFV